MFILHPLIFFTKVLRTYALNSVYNCLFKFFFISEHSQWSLWYECSKSCGGGERLRQRNVTIYFDLSQFYVASEWESELCNIQPCPGKITLKGELSCMFKFSNYGTQIKKQLNQKVFCCITFFQASF